MKSTLFFQSNLPCNRRVHQLASKEADKKTIWDYLINPIIDEEQVDNRNFKNREPNKDESPESSAKHYKETESPVQKVDHNRGREIVTKIGTRVGSEYVVDTQSFFTRRQEEFRQYRMKIKEDKLKRIEEIEARHKYVMSTVRMQLLSPRVDAAETKNVP